MQSSVWKYRARLRWATFCQIERQCAVICAVTRAIHLELCTDVSATVLILAISRFSTRRGLPKLFVSDNFKSFKSIELKNFWLKGGIKWQFILEKSPWWGAFYECLVGIVKNSLKKVTGKALCNYEQLTAYLCELERVIIKRMQLMRITRKF